MAAGTGLPIRGLAIVLGLWIGTRLTFLFSVVEPLIDTIRPAPPAFSQPPPTIFPPPGPAPIATPAPHKPTPPPFEKRRPPSEAPPTPARLPIPSIVPLPDIPPPPMPRHAEPVPVAPPPAPPSANRWHASAWILWRPDRRNALALPAGQLGASQAGLRIDRDLLGSGSPGRLTAYTRATAALVRPAQPEAALGLALQPDRALPVTLAIERRIALGTGARNAMAAMVYGGLPSTPIVHGVEAEAYGQAGIVGFHRGDRFIDGKLSLLAPVKHAPVRVGLALSGGAQPRIHRLDLGPEVQLRLPLATGGGRLSIEWRQRLLGNARPHSGLAITLAGDI